MCRSTSCGAGKPTSSTRSTARSRPVTVQTFGNRQQPFPPVSVAPVHCRSASVRRAFRRRSGSCDCLPLARRGRRHPPPRPPFARMPIPRESLGARATLGRWVGTHAIRRQGCCTLPQKPIAALISRTVGTRHRQLCGPYRDYQSLTAIISTLIVIISTLIAIIRTLFSTLFSTITVNVADNVVIPLHALAHSKVGHKGGVPKR